jgi:hypothetical protein
MSGKESRLVSALSTTVESYSMKSALVRGSDLTALLRLEVYSV